MVKKFSAVVLARPVDENDPLLFQRKGSYLYPRILNSLLEEKIVSKVIISVPGYIPKSILDQLGTWGYGLHVSVQDAPQARLGEIIEDQESDGFVILTPYSYLVSSDTVSTALEKMCNGNCDLVFPLDVVEAKYFLVINSKGIDVLSSNVMHSLPPFAFPKVLEKIGGELKISGIAGLESSTERFLWETTYGKSRNLPECTFLKDYLDDARVKDPSIKQFSKTFLEEKLEIRNWDKLSKVLDRIFLIQESITLSHQVTFLHTVLSRLPDRKDCFLEIGFGVTPVNSSVLSNVFKNGICCEPVNYDSDGIELAKSLAVQLVNESELLHGQVPPYLSLESISEKVEFHPSYIEEIALQENSIDFCFSFSVFEHILEVIKVSRLLYKVLRPGGKMLHGIGFMDHDDMTHINFNFLKYSKEKWGLINHQTNLWRVNEICSLWEKLGFDICILQKEVRISPPDNLHESWQDYKQEDLYCYWAVIEARKPFDG